MDTNETKEGKSECGQCGWCGWCGGHGMGGMNRRHLGRVIVKILVALFIFWCGVQFGELKSLLHSGYGYGMMGAYGAAGQNYFYRTTPDSMMGGWTQQGTAAQ